MEFLILMLTLFFFYAHIIDELFYWYWTSGIYVKNWDFIWSGTGRKVNYTNWDRNEPNEYNLYMCIGMSYYTIIPRKRSGGMKSVK